MITVSCDMCRAVISKPEDKLVVAGESYDLCRDCAEKLKIVVEGDDHR